MNKIIKMAVVAAGVGAMLGFAGCSNDESQYEALLREASKITNEGKVNEQDVETLMEAYRARTAEQKKEILEQTKKDMNELKKMAGALKRR